MAAMMKLCLLLIFALASSVVSETDAPRLRASYMQGDDTIRNPEQQTNDHAEDRQQHQYRQQPIIFDSTQDCMEACEREGKSHNTCKEFCNNSNGQRKKTRERSDDNDSSGGYIKCMLECFVDGEKNENKCDSECSKFGEDEVASAIGNSEYHLHDHSERHQHQTRLQPIVFDNTQDCMELCEREGKSYSTCKDFCNSSNNGQRKKTRERSDADEDDSSRGYIKCMLECFVDGEKSENKCDSECSKFY